MWVDAIRKIYASFLPDGCVAEYYVPAQHDTRCQGAVALWQAKADRLAKAGLRLACPFAIHLCSHLPELYLLFLDGDLVCNAVHALDDLYVAGCRSRGPHPGDSDTACWQCTLFCHNLPNNAIKFAYLLRAAPFYHRLPKAEFHCYICCAVCSSWGQHMPYDCVAVVLACLLDFCAAGTFAWRSVNSFLLECAGAPLVWTPSFPTYTPLSSGPWLLFPSPSRTPPPPATPASSGSSPTPSGTTWEGTTWRTRRTTHGP